VGSSADVGSSASSAGNVDLAPVFGDMLHVTADHCPVTGSAMIVSATMTADREGGEDGGCAVLLFFEGEAVLRRHAYRS
jgi:hypothetical protein